MDCACDVRGIRQAVRIDVKWQCSENVFQLFLTRRFAEAPAATHRPETAMVGVIGNISAIAELWHPDCFLQTIEVALFGQWPGANLRCQIDSEYATSQNPTTSHEGIFPDASWFRACAFND
jgi:hypothetical protein